MKTDAVLLLHGYASSNQSSNAIFFRQKLGLIPEVEFEAIDFNPTPRDFEYMTLTGMINRVRQYVLDRPYKDIGIIGSSLGALVGLNYAHRFGGVDWLVLLAPALAYVGSISGIEAQQWREKGSVKVHHYAFDDDVEQRYDIHYDGQLYVQPVPPPAPIMIIHGRHDDVVPIEYSREYAAKYPDQVTLIEVGSGHRLNDQLAEIWQHMMKLLPR